MDLAHKITSAKVLPEGENTRKYSFTFSTPEIDRDKDSVNQLGIDFTAFKRNPVVQWAHQYSLPPVARVAATWIRDGKTMGTVEFPPEGVSALSDTLEGLVRYGFLNAVSIGYMPIKQIENDLGGYDIQSLELLEISLVPLPSNRSALLEASAKGVNITPVVQWAKNILGDEPPPVEEELPPAVVTILEPVIPAPTVEAAKAPPPPANAIVQAPPFGAKLVTNAVKSALKDLACEAVKRHTGRL